MWVETVGVSSSEFQLAFWDPEALTIRDSVNMDLLLVTMPATISYSISIVQVLPMDPVN